MSQAHKCLDFPIGICRIAASDIGGKPIKVDSRRTNRAPQSQGSWNDARNTRVSPGKCGVSDSEMDSDEIFSGGWSVTQEKFKPIGGAPPIQGPSRIFRAVSKADNSETGSDIGVLFQAVIATGLRDRSSESELDVLSEVFKKYHISKCIEKMKSMTTNSDFLKKSARNQVSRIRLADTSPSISTQL